MQPLSTLRDGNCSIIKYISFKIKVITRKILNYVSALIGAVQTIAIASMIYFSPEYSVAINSSIVIAGTAVI